MQGHAGAGAMTHSLVHQFPPPDLLIASWHITSPHVMRLAVVTRYMTPSLATMVEMNIPTCVCHFEFSRTFLKKLLATSCFLSL